MFIVFFNHRQTTRHKEIMDLLCLMLTQDIYIRYKASMTWLKGCLDKRKLQHFILQYAKPTQKESLITMVSYLEFILLKCSLSDFQYIYKDMQASLQSNSRTCHHPQKKPTIISTCSPFSSPPSLWQPLIFLPVWICFFWTFYVNRIIKYVAFCV